MSLKASSFHYSPSALELKYGRLAGETRCFHRTKCGKVYRDGSGSSSCDREVLKLATDRRYSSTGRPERLRFRKKLSFVHIASLVGIPVNAVLIKVEADLGSIEALIRNVEADLENVEALFINVEAFLGNVRGLSIIWTIWTSISDSP